MLCAAHGDPFCMICKVDGHYLPRSVPVIGGRRVPSELTTIYDYICGVHRLPPESFFNYEPEDSPLRAARDLGMAAGSIGWRVDVQHEVAVAANDPSAWFYLRHGHSSPEDIARDNRVDGIPQLGMREAFIASLMRVKLTGEPLYEFVESEPGKCYWRLLWPVTDDRGYVVRVISSIVSEPRQASAA